MLENTTRINLNNLAEHVAFLTGEALAGRLNAETANLRSLMAAVAGICFTTLEISQRLHVIEQKLDALSALAGKQRG
jgi:AraC-like DNA-binding protein